MTGMNKRSTDPKVDQNKMKVNPLYNTSMYIKAVGDRLREVMGPKKKPK